ncbi:MAG: hypothetical protein ABUS56_07230 [Acidobacteriota bacterium]
MVSNRVGVVAVALACVAAAGAGGYFAVKQNTVPAPAAAAVADVTPRTNPVAPQPAPGVQAVPGTQAAPVEAPAASAPLVTAATPAAPRAPLGPRPAPRQVARASARQAPDVPDTPRQSGVGAPLPQAAPPPVPAPDTAADRVDEHVAQAPPAPVEPPQKTFEELVVSANSVIGLQTENRLSSDTARVEDRVDAKVTRDVRVADKIAVPAGSHAVGYVTLVERGGKFKERARIGIRFTSLVLADGTRLPMSTETIYREGDAPGNGSAAKIGGGVIAGTILGAILGGGKGAAIGATAGATGGAVAVEAGERSTVTLPAGSPMTVRLLSPVAVTIEQK